uniref:T9SS type A sorting domain-containing protein n=1 Tax=candidate division WOR-3 bacterium TaxID=2052148 RepID=A0A7C6EDS4_UNCW3
MKKFIILIFSILAIGVSLPITSAPEFSDKFVAGHLIVKFKPEYRGLINIQYRDGIALTGIPEIDELNKTFRTKTIDKAYRNPNLNESGKRFGIDLVYLFTFPYETKVVDLVKGYQNCPAIEHVSPNFVYELDYVPNDSLYSRQWHHRNLQCARAWDISQGDTAVWIAIVDEGLEWTHPDIEDNLWINPEEDINHNGRFDLGPPPGGDEDGVDNDGNGYIDDVIGWDFYYWDNNPINENLNESHGTLCFGAAVAVTDNLRGVAGIGFNSRGAGLRCGDETGIYTYCAIQAIYYAADNGAFAISMSWGGAGYQSELNNAIQYAWSQGCVLSASAGNTYSGGSPRYPANYDHVIATAASDSFDRRSIWSPQEQSNYGPWVDLAAPGTDVYTTNTGNRYWQEFGGTSAASPCVGGLAVLLKSAYPAMTNAECTTRIFQSCDSMPDSTYRLGLLGHGRINVGKALHQPISCYLQMTDYRIVDRTGNNNGYPDLGETCAVVITLLNDPYWQTATNVSATLATLDTTITILHPTATFPDIPPGTSRNCSADSFVFVVHPNAVPHRIKFTIAKNSTPVSYDLDDAMTIAIGAPRVILVDDDDGGNVELWYKQACDSLGVLYKVWTVSSSGSPTLDTLNHYPVVVWFCGIDSTQTLTQSDMNALSSYLDNGGNLFLCGQNLGQEIGSQPFYSNYLHTRYLINRVTTGTMPRVYGIDGDPISNSSAETLALMGTGGANNAVSMDGVQPIDGAVGCYHYVANPDSIYGATHYSNSYKVVYFAFPFEAIAGSPTRYTQKWRIMARILTFFGEALPPTEINEETKTFCRIGLPSLSFIPNPFTKQTTIRFQIADFKNAQLNFYNATGKKVKTINLAKANNLIQSVIWEGRDKNERMLPTGVYFVELKNGDRIVSGKVLLMR